MAGIEDLTNSDWRPEALAPHYGNAVTGDRYWPRPELEEEVLELLTGGGHVQMFGLRRIGKSSITLRVLDQLNQRKIPCVWFDAQGFKTADELLGGILKALPVESKIGKQLLKLADDDGIQGAVKKTLACLAKRSFADAEFTDGLKRIYWSTACDVISTAVEQSKESLVIMIDEFPMMCEGLLDCDDHGLSFVEDMLSEFRDWRRAGIHFLLTGSIGMRQLCRKSGIKTVHLNDFTQVDVPPLEREEAERFLAALTHSSPSKDWSEEAAGHFLDACGALYPSIIQDAYKKIRLSKARDKEEIATLFAKKIRPNLFAPFFDQFRDRIKDYGGEDSLDKTARKLVLELEAPGGQMTQSEIYDLGSTLSVAEDKLDELLPMMREDGFLHADYPIGGEPVWYCASDLVRQWSRQAPGRGRR